jgi:hypothetical protein
MIDTVGAPTWETLGEGQALLTSIPEDIRQAVKTPQGAACVIYALLLDPSPDRRDLQLRSLGRALVLQGDTDRVAGACVQLSALQKGLRLPLLEIAMPALSGLTSMEKRNFLLILNSLIHADGRISLFELSVQWILEKYLNPSEDLFRSIIKFSYSGVGLDIIVLISALASVGHRGDAACAQAAFDAGIRRIPELAARKPVFDFDQNDSYAKVNRALGNLTAASFKIRESVIDASAHCTFADKTVTVEEAELLRVIALALQCPLPPFVSGMQESNLSAA